MLYTKHWGGKNCHMHLRGPTKLQSTSVANVEHVYGRLKV